MSRRACLEEYRNCELRCGVTQVVGDSGLFSRPAPPQIILLPLERLILEAAQKNPVHSPIGVASVNSLLYVPSANALDLSRATSCRWLHSRPTNSTLVECCTRPLYLHTLRGILHIRVQVWRRGLRTPFLTFRAYLVILFALLYCLYTPSLFEEVQGSNTSRI